MRDHVAHRHAAQGGGQLGQEIAHLVGVREQHDRRASPSPATAAAPRCSHPACSPPAARAPRRRLFRVACRPVPPPALRCPAPAPPRWPWRRVRRPSAGRRPGSRTTCGSTRRRAVPLPPGCSYDARLELQFLHQFGGGFPGVAVEHLRLLGALGQVDAIQRDAGRGRRAAQFRRASGAGPPWSWLS